MRYLEQSNLITCNALPPTLDRGFSFHKMLCSVLQLSGEDSHYVMVWKKEAKTKHTQTGPSKHSGEGGRGKKGKEDEFALEENTEREILRYRHNTSKRSYKHTHTYMLYDKLQREFNNSTTYIRCLGIDNHVTVYMIDYTVNNLYYE